MKRVVKFENLLPLVEAAFITGDTDDERADYLILALQAVTNAKSHEALAERVKSTLDFYAKKQS